jgi:anti-sigma factor RsiW
MSASVTCHEFVDFLDDYLAGRLGPEQLAAFNEHLSVCPSCVAYMKTYRATVELGKEALNRSDKPVSADVPEDLVRAILASRPKS